MLGLEHYHFGGHNWMHNTEESTEIQRKASEILVGIWYCPDIQTKDQWAQFAIFCPPEIHFILNYSWKDVLSSTALGLRSSLPLPKVPHTEVALRERPPTGGEESSLESKHTHPHTPSSLPRCADGATSLQSQSQTQRHWSTVSPGSALCSILWPSCQNGGGGPRTDPLLQPCTSCRASLLKEAPWWSLPGSEITGALLSGEWSKYFSLALGPLDSTFFLPHSQEPWWLFLATCYTHLAIHMIGCLCRALSPPVPTCRGSPIPWRTCWKWVLPPLGAHHILLCFVLIRGLLSTSLLDSKLIEGRHRLIHFYHCHSDVLFNRFCIMLMSIC